jgi:hypothetical protein
MADRALRSHFKSSALIDASDDRVFAFLDDPGARKDQST